MIFYIILWKYTQYYHRDFVHIILDKEQAEKHIIDYSPLWKTMSEKSVSQYHLLKSGIDNKTLDSLKKNKNITLLTVEKICRILDCTPNDIVEFKE